MFQIDKKIWSQAELLYEALLASHSSTPVIAWSNWQQKMGIKFNHVLLLKPLTIEVLNDYA